MNKHEASALLTRTITNVLIDYPELAGEAAAAIGAGVSAGVDRLREENGKAQRAMAMALALLPPNRINAKMQDTLEQVVREAITGSYMCPAEAAFVARIDGKAQPTEAA